MEEILARKFQVLGEELNERQRRLWATSEALLVKDNVLPKWNYMIKPR